MEGPLIIKMNEKRRQSCLEDLSLLIQKQVPDRDFTASREMTANNTIILVTEGMGDRSHTY